MLQEKPCFTKVLEKIGMTQEGLLREEIQKWDKSEDLLVYGILKNEWK